MSDTRFSLFAKRLYPIIGEGTSQENFVLQLLESITSIDGEETVEDIIKVAPSTLRAYYSGSRDITRKVSKITGYIDTVKFEDFIDGKGDDTQQKLCEVFADEFPNATPLDIGKNLSELFRSIIYVGKTADLSPKLPLFDSLQAFSNNCSLEIRTELFLQQGGKCPIPNCGNRLAYVENKIHSIDFDVIQIESNAGDTANNMLGVCHNCFRRIKSHSLNLPTEALKKIKKDIEETDNAEYELLKEELENGITNVIHRISNFSDEESMAILSFNPVAIENKIEKQNGLLLKRISHHVEDYFNFISDVLKEADQAGIIHLSQFRKQLRNSFERIKDVQTDQNEIFELLARRLSDITKESAEACAALISYFIQECDVFDAITK